MKYYRSRTTGMFTRVIRKLSRHNRRRNLPKPGDTVYPTHEWAE